MTMANQAIRWVVAAILFAGAGAAGCAVDASGASEEALLPAPPSEGGLQLRLHAPIDLAEEARLCRLVVLPGGDGLGVAAFEHELGDGAAEVRLSLTTLSIDDAWARPGRVDCAELDAVTTETVYASTEPSGLVELDAALPLAPLAVVRVEARFAPRSGAPVASSVAVNLWLDRANAAE